MNASKLIALTTLNTAPSHIEAVRAKIKQATGALPQFSSVAKILRALEKEGYAQSTWDAENSRSGQPRHIYQITNQGQRRLTALRIEAKATYGEIILC